MSRKYALVIGNTDYIDQGLARLSAPGKDTEDFARILQNKELCSFDEVKTLLNQPEHIIRRTIDEFFDQKKPDDLLVFYFSGHGVRDELGVLYLAVKNTDRFRLRSTAIKSNFIREAMDQSRSKRQVLILDCCNSGAFAQGTKAATGVSIGTATAFESGYGRIILTASDSIQFAWEGDKVIGNTENSLFTHFLIKGLEGQADYNGDGRITVDELYDYAYQKIADVTPKQTPTKSGWEQEGEIILRDNIPVENVAATQLPIVLLDQLESPFPEVRIAVVRELEKLANSKNLKTSSAAQKALQQIASGDDSHRVREETRRMLERTNAKIPERLEPHKDQKSKTATKYVSIIGLTSIALIIGLIASAATYYFRSYLTANTPTVVITQTTFINASNNNLLEFTKTPTPSSISKDFSPTTSTPSNICNLTYCDNASESFCIYSIAPQPTSLIIAIKYMQEIDDQNLPQLIVDSHKFECELLAAYPGRIYCNGSTVSGATTLRLVSPANTTICSGAFNIKEFVAPSPTPKKNTEKNKYP